MSKVERLERRSVISGIGQSQVGRRLGRTDIDLTVEACIAAIADAGLSRDDIDGLSTYPPGEWARAGSPGRRARTCRTRCACASTGTTGA